MFEQILGQRFNSLRYQRRLNILSNFTNNNAKVKYVLK